jgi:hypothetical protein
MNWRASETGCSSWRKRRTDGINLFSWNYSCLLHGIFGKRNEMLFEGIAPTVASAASSLD